MSEPMKRSDKGWYYTYWSECPVCGEWRCVERIKKPFPKPDSWDDRNEVTTSAHSGHFL